MNYVHLYKLLQSITKRFKHNVVQGLQLIKKESICTYIIVCQVLYYVHYGGDHVQLTLLNWDNKSVLALNEKLKFPIHFRFLFSAKTLLVSQLSKVNCRWSGHKYIFSSNHNIHKSSCVPCFWASDPLINRF